MPGARLRSLAKISAPSAMLVFASLLAPAAPAQQFYGEESRLDPFDGVPEDSFGFAVAVDGDGAAVGAPLHDHGVFRSGSVYVFVRDANGWAFRSEVRSSTPEDHAFFGFSVDLEEGTLAVGAPNDGPVPVGHAYVLERSGSSWVETAVIRPAALDVGDDFGYAIDMSGDTLLIGAPGDDQLGGDAGAAYVYVRRGSTWVEEAKLVAADGEANDWFGNAVSIDGDTALVGSWLSDVGFEQNAGAAYVFSRRDGVWTEEARLTAGDGTYADGLGWRVYLFGDAAVATAERLSSDGGAYVFRHGSHGWSEQAILTASDAYTYQQFGYAVDLYASSIVVGTGD